MEEKDLQKDFLSLTNKCWKLKNFDERETENISQNFGFSYLLAKLFNIRKINISDIDQYINPSLKDLIIGMPPATEASYSRFTLFFSAK